MVYEEMAHLCFHFKLLGIKNGVIALLISNGSIYILKRTKHPIKEKVGNHCFIFNYPI